MGATPLEAIVSGLALGGVLAVAAAWSRAVGGTRLPHLGVGAMAGLGMMLANRVSGPSDAATALLVLLVGAAAGFLVGRLQRRVDGSGDPAGPPDGPPLLGDVAVLAALVAGAAALRPPLAIPVAFGPLGGRPGSGGAVAALVVGAAGAWLVARTRRRPGRVWWLAGAATALAAALGGGALWPAAPALVALPTVIDSANLAFRAAAAALLGRGGPAQAAAAGLAIGVAEGLLWLASPAGLLGAVPAVLAAAIGLWAARTPADRLEALRP